jgi:hypothetical protein
MDTSELAFPKPLPRIVARHIRKLDLAQLERQCRTNVRRRDKGKCVVPGCKERGSHLHHIVYRSHSRRMTWLTSNCASLCPSHHALQHAGKISISGNADEHLTITGARKYLAFRL